MFDEPDREVLDLTVTTKGIGNAFPASTESQGGGTSCSSTLSSSLCCSFHLCV